MTNRLETLQKQKRELEASIGVCRVTGQGITELETELANIEKLIGELRRL